MIKLMSAFPFFSWVYQLHCVCWGRLEKPVYTYRCRKDKGNSLFLFMHLSIKKIAKALGIHWTKTGYIFWIFWGERFVLLTEYSRYLWENFANIRILPELQIFARRGFVKSTIESVTAWPSPRQSRGQSCKTNDVGSQWAFPIEPALNTNLIIFT